MLCEYGCGKQATHQFKNGKWCCSKNQSSCNSIKEKLSKYKSFLGKKHTNETKEKMSILKKDYIPWNKNKVGCFSEETIIKMKKSSINKRLSFETIDKIRKSKIGLIMSEETKLKISKSNKGKRRSEELKEKLSILNKGQIPWNKDLKNVYSEITLKKMSNCRIGKKPSKETLLKQSKSMKIWMNSIEGLKFRERTRQKMLNGGASYLNSFIKNPSKPQVELFNVIKQIYPLAILNYPLKELNYSLDIAIPELKIWIESDGSYWHQDNQKDLKRQRKIENLGWKCIRYKADDIKDIPHINKIKKDINEVI
jgi:hypothetical protein